MNSLKQMESFVAVVKFGSLSAAARQDSVVPAVMGRRLDALENRLGVKLLVRTTRSLTLTQEGSAFYEDCLRILAELSEAETAVASGSARARGHLRVSAPAGFGRRHVAPHACAFQQANPDIKLTLDLSDRIVDLLRERIDCAIRISDLADSSLVALRLAQNRRVVVAAPAYLARCGIPRSLDDLSEHGARSVLKTAKDKDDRLSCWVQSVCHRRNKNIAAVALANKTMRMAWALLTSGADYQPEFGQPDTQPA